MANEEHSEVVNFLLKKSEEKDPEPQRHKDDVDKEEIEELTKKIKERIKV
ncbi:MAG: hypothetical protein KKA79_05420 [Nanoarchaeota archaeon]|nr:hypothetical protein [Nanoarchaeota archaeon]